MLPNNKAGICVSHYITRTEALATYIGTKYAIHLFVPVIVCNSFITE